MSKAEIINVFAIDPDTGENVTRAKVSEMVFDSLLSQVEQRQEQSPTVINVFAGYSSIE